MPNLLTVSPGQIIEANDWNKVVDDLNLLTQALKIEDDWGAGQPAQGGDLSIKGQSNGEATLYLGAPSSGFFVKAKEDGPDPGLTIGAKNAGKGIVISVGGDTRIGGGNPSRAKLEIDGGDKWISGAWNKSLLLSAETPSIAFTNAQGIRFGIGMNSPSDPLLAKDSTKLHIFSTFDSPLLVDDSSGGGNAQSHLIIQSNGNVGIGINAPTARLQVEAIAPDIESVVSTKLTGTVGIFMPFNERVALKAEVGVNNANNVGISSNVSGDGILGQNVGVKSIASGSQTCYAVHGLINDSGTAILGTLNLSGNSVGSAIEGRVSQDGPNRYAGNFVGKVRIRGISGSNDGVLNLEGIGSNGRTFLQFFPTTGAVVNNGRKAWLGFGGQGSSSFAINNQESNGNLELSTNADILLNTGIGRKIRVNGGEIVIVRLYNLTTNSTVNTGAEISKYNAVIVAGTGASLSQSSNIWMVDKIPGNNIALALVFFIRKEISDIPFPIL